MTGAVGVADAGSVVFAGSAGTTVTGSASGGCDMVGALLQENESKRQDKNPAVRQKNKWTQVGYSASTHSQHCTWIKKKGTIGKRS